MEVSVLTKRPFEGLCISLAWQQTLDILFLELTYVYQYCFDPYYGDKKFKNEAKLLSKREICHYVATIQKLSDQ